MTDFNLDTLALSASSHATRDQGVCVMEAVAWAAGEPHSDAPKCACPVARKLAVVINDRLTDADRVALKPYIMRLVGSRASPEVTRRRMFALVDTSVRVWAPARLDRRGKSADAARLRRLPEIVGRATARAAAYYAAAAAADDAYYAAAAAADDAYSAADAAADAAYSAAAAAAADDAYYAAAAAADAAARSTWMLANALPVLDRILTIK